MESQHYWTASYQKKVDDLEVKRFALSSAIDCAIASNSLYTTLDIIDRAEAFHSFLTKGIDNGQS